MNVLKKALYYHKCDSDRVKCTLCPHECILSHDQLGYCGVRKNINGDLYSLSYKKVSSIAIDPMEKKPLYDFMPGSEILSIGSIGCNMSCLFCQNYSISKVFDMDNLKEVAASDIVTTALEEGLKSLAFTYNEPIVGYEFLLDTFKLAKEKGLKTVLVTNAYINPSPFINLMPYIDAMNIDVKSSNHDAYYKFCHGSIEPVMEIIKLAARQSIHLEITCLIVPGLFEDRKAFKALMIDLRQLAGDIVIHLSRYFPRYKMDDKATSIPYMLELQGIARQVFSRVYLGNV